MGKLEHEFEGELAKHVSVSGRKPGFVLMGVGGVASALGIVALVMASHHVDPGVRPPKIIVLPIALGFVTFYVGILKAVFGDKVTQMQGGEQEISCLQLAAILGPFVLLLMGLIPIVGAFAN